MNKNVVDIIKECHDKKYVFSNLWRGNVMYNVSGVFRTLSLYRTHIS